MHSLCKRKESRHCLICFANSQSELSFSFFFQDERICDSCKKQFSILMEEQKIADIPTLFLYEYDNFLKSLIYRFKGCRDYVLKDVFFYFSRRFLKKKYRHYTIIFPPSFSREGQSRNFQHIAAMCECLHLPMEDLFYKKSNYKQSDMPFEERSRVKEIIQLQENKKIVDKKYLVVDDIYTSGNTLKAIYAILRKNQVKKENIRGLIVAKVQFFV